MNLYHCYYSALHGQVSMRSLSAALTASAMQWCWWAMAQREERTTGSLKTGEHITSVKYFMRTLDNGVIVIVSFFLFCFPELYVVFSMVVLIR